MAELLDAFAFAATQHVDHMGCTKALAGAVNAAQGFLCRQRGIPAGGGLQAVVAVAAGLRIGFAEAGQQYLAAALHGFAIAQQLVQLASFQLLAFLTCLRLFDHLLQQHHVAHAVTQPRFGRFAVAAGTAGFLVITFQ